jgi:hypothetical protein
MRARQDMVDRRGFVCKAATLAGATAFMPSVAARATAPGGPSTIQLAQTQLAQSVAASATPLTIKSVERLVGSTINYAYAVKAGPWIFLNGHEAYDFEKGLAPEVEGPRGYALSGRPPLRREADYILARMRGILKDFGSDLPNAVRVDQYYTMGPAVSAYHLARFAEFEGYIPPSTSIIMERCFSTRTNTHTSSESAGVNQSQHPAIRLRWWPTISFSSLATWHCSRTAPSGRAWRYGPRRVGEAKPAF